MHHDVRLRLKPDLPACPLKSLPAGLQLPPQLADPCPGDSELSRSLTGRIAQREGLGNPAVPLGERTKPRCHINSGSRDIRRSGTMVFNKRLAPIPRLVIKLV